ncbi:PREDICTED: leukocyte immunoglobulin-like receptor subfamily A member 6 [Myotis brandtii]|uniref:leukocyte immunoglobulin-like receptor subfamily A member 6 n=1 Tax=Myotis brandtii TaxID=109478 RepID=UPI000703CB7A|nr:PREDICTED: leukocyte immunoglobulin-like receptor subfamily A member 6 [Myotis brandtii]
MTATSTAFLCLEPLPKPTIWAAPSAVITAGRPVSIWCHGSRKADRYHLYQKWAPGSWRSAFPQGPRDKAEFPIPLMTQGLAGRYHCTYESRRASSAPSEPLDLVVTGMFDPPTLSALPRPVVTSGGSVTLQCGSWQGFDWFYLCDKGRHDHYQRLDSQPREDGWFQALFTVGPVRPTHWWTYRCYGVFSGSPHAWSSSSSLVELLISGDSRKPSLSVLPGPVVAPGDTLTLRCQSDVNYDRFALFKMGEHDLHQQCGWQPQAGLSQADFSLGPVSGYHGGRYRCYGGYNLSSEWSTPSDPVDIQVTGKVPDTLPALSAQPGSTVALGENVTLRCQTGSLFDTFLLFKEGDVGPPLHLKSRYQDGVFQANFPMSPVTLDHGGTYRCYGSLSGTPVQLSRPSNPLELKVEGDPVNIIPSVQTPNSTSGPQVPDYTVENHIAMGLSGLILVVLGVLVFQAWYSERRSPGVN